MSIELSVISHFYQFIRACVYRIIMTAASSLSVSSTSCSQSRCATWKHTQVRIHREWGWGWGGLLTCSQTLVRVIIYTRVHDTLIHTSHSHMYAHFSTMHVTSTHTLTSACIYTLINIAAQFLNLTLLGCYVPTSQLQYHYGPWVVCRQCVH